MLKLLGRWFNVYKAETGLFLWMALLRTLLVCGVIIITNYADTVFLTRFGVEKLPFMLFINPIVGILVMAVLTGFMVKMPGTRLLAYLFVFFGVTAGVCWFIIPYDIQWLYPFLWLLKAQATATLGLLFLNLSNDLFNVRQSKRLFPSIAAVAVVGEILFNYSSPHVARLMGIDNLLLVYLVTMILAALVVKRIGSLFPTLLVAEKESGKPKKKKGMKTQVKEAMPLVRKSTLIKVMVILFLIPTAALTVITVQFNFFVDAYAGTEETKMIFFGYFRAVSGVFNLIILLFANRIYGRWGLPVALMIHPFNYILAFLSFLFSFSFASGIYARLSTQVLSKAINIPARSVLMGLLPKSQRAIMLPFLRGVVPKGGQFLGSTISIVFTNLMHVRYLSIIILPFILVWLAASFVLKRNYSKILLELISKNILDLKTMEQGDMENLFRDKRIREQLIQTFCATRGKECLWYAGLLKSLAVEELDANILKVLRDQDDRTRIGLLSLLSSDPEADAGTVLADLVDHKKPDLMAAIVTAANRLELEYSPTLNNEAFENAAEPEVRALAMAGLCRSNPGKYCQLIDTWLGSASPDERLAGVIAAGSSAEKDFIGRLVSHLEAAENQPIAHKIIESLHNLGAADINDIVEPFLAHNRKNVRMAALKAFNIVDDASLRRVVSIIGDPSEKLSQLAMDKISKADYQNGQLLIEALNIPRRKIREGVFELLEELKIGDIDAFRFARSGVEESYTCLAVMRYVRSSYSGGEKRDLLMGHLEQKSRLEIENVLRVLALQDKTGQMKIVSRGIFSADKMQQANSMEALDDLLDRSLSKILLPLLGGAPFSEKLLVGRRHFKLPVFGEEKENLLAWMVEREEWLSVVLLMNLLAEDDLKAQDIDIIKELEKSEKDQVRKTAHKVLIKAGLYVGVKEDEMTAEVVITDKILLLKKIEMFEGLTVAELAAVGSVAEELQYEPGEVVIKRGDMGETMYLILSGEVSVHIGDESGREIEVDRIKAGDYFGEMALFEDVERSATILTESKSRLLVIHKQEFNEIVREYPQIALTICKVLSSRIRTLHSKIKADSAS